MIKRPTGIILAMLLCASRVAAAPACLTDADAREEAQNRRLVSVQHAITTARQRSKGELLSAHLCRSSDGFVYRISILGRDGRVDRVLIDAANGQFSN